MSDTADIVVIGAGAAGLMAAIWAGRSVQAAGGVPRVVALDGARKIGAKILVAGGGRCNVTHHEVDEAQYAGSSRHAIKKVLRRFGVPEAVEFFRALGVELKREETGKLFPTTDDAHTVLVALLRGAAHAGVQIRNPARVTAVERLGQGFRVRFTTPVEVGPTPGEGELIASRIVMATGGKSLPRTGSDGLGYELLKLLGHSITPRVFPALVPLTLPKEHWICGLSGLTLPASLELRSGTGKRLRAFTNSTLCTHFGLSGPGVLDMSRYYTNARFDDPGAGLVMNWLPGETAESMDNLLRGLGSSTVLRALSDRLPERLVRAVCEQAGVEAGTTGHTLTRDIRRAVATLICETPLPITGDRGFTFAEVTAGGVPLSEVRLETMESRICPGLFLCGEVCDVDGRIGGFNFQWAWASGFVAGVGAANQGASG